LNPKKHQHLGGQSTLSAIPVPLGHFCTGVVPDVVGGVVPDVEHRQFRFFLQYLMWYFAPRLSPPSSHRKEVPAFTGMKHGDILWWEV
jgi:hypothetical protein